MPREPKEPEPKEAEEPAVPGLRERKKQELRRLLSDLALELFAERGFDAVKVADIAAAANVSEKTVFNYFATKEDLLLGERAAMEAELVRAVRERAAGVSVLAVVRQHTLAIAKRLHDFPAARRAAFRKIVQSTPSVHTRMRQMSLQYEEELGELLAEEVGAGPHDPTPRVVASVIGALTRLGYGVAGWPPGKARSYAETQAGIAAAFDQLERGLGGYGLRKRGT